MKKTTVFFDFDGTITKKDTIDELLLHFSSNGKWQKFEHAWRKGKIGSRDCLKGQLNTIKFTKEALKDFLSKVKIDPHFKKLIVFLQKNNIEHAILSDSFDHFIKSILKQNNINVMKVRSNKIRIGAGTFKTSFPHFNRSCGRCGHCKKSSIYKFNTNGRKVIYIGDGLSDLCAAKHADIVFAKNELISLCRSNSIRHIPFKNLLEPLRYLRRYANRA